MADYAALLQLAVTLNIAFITAGNIRSFTKIVVDRLFNLTPTITERAQQSRNSLDIETFKNLSPRDFGIKTTGDWNTLKDLKDKAQKIAKDIAQKETELKDDSAKLFTGGNESLLCLFYTLFSFVLLFFINSNNEYVCCGFAVAFVLSLIITIVYLLKKKSRNVLLAMAYVAGVLILSVGVTMLAKHNDYTHPITHYARYLIAFMPFVHFFVFALSAKPKSKKIENRVFTVFDSIDRQREELHKEKNQLFKVHHKNA